MKSNKELMVMARESLAGKWEVAVVTFLVFGLLAGIGGPIGLVITGPLLLGTAYFSLNLTRGKKAEFVQLFEGLNNFVETLIAYLLMVLYIFLWFLLLIVPGIIAAIAYSQTFYIMADDKNIKGVNALKKSREMMCGNKGKYFALLWRFLGWFLLSVLTLGIGFFWLIPYINVTTANFYEDIKK